MYNNFRIELKTACQMLLSLGGESRAYYEQQFEEHFLTESAEFYRRASQKFLGDNSASVYVHKVNECLQDETQRAERYLGKSLNENLTAVSYIALRYFRQENRGEDYRSAQRRTHH